MTVLTSVLTPPAPGPVDLLFHTADRLASHPEAASTVGVVLQLTGETPDLRRLRERLARRLHRLPCLTHLLVTDEGPPRWTPSPPDLDDHITERHVTAADLHDTLRALLRDPLPADAPAWRLTVLSGHAPRAYCLALITTHAVQDAANLVAVAEILLGPDDDTLDADTPNADTPNAETPDGDTPATTTTGPARKTEAPPSPRRLLDTTAYLWRSTRPHALWSDPDRPLSGRRHVLWQEVPTRLLKETARAYGATSNDVHLAALAHAVSRWAAEHRPDADLDVLPLMLPVNLRTPTETALPGNRFFLARLDLPGGPMTVTRRLNATLPATAPLKDPAYRGTLRHLLTQDPSQYAQLIARTAAPESLTVVGSMYRIANHLSYDGDPVDRVIPIICCPDGFPLTVGLFLYGDTSTASFQIDHALPGAASIPRLWRRALDDMATCAPGGAR
ncbi:wax ester/triacylglycerol synthase domain-containing protein [Streptomyces sp. NPDC046909]|uniref:wax ester/triacylglycerol synthase domain-containing protein n=1 Tax=Streptomyces sp. NPDC046909 TaxID=3155617 RepID=UPI0033F12022